MSRYVCGSKTILVDDKKNLKVITLPLLCGRTNGDEACTLCKRNRCERIKKQIKTENPAKLFGSPVSQYFRFRIDGRYYLKTGKEARIATRLYTGIGLPYGNSTVMPYVKQFYAGGTNSIRAFRARSVGPGSYHPPDSLNNVLIDQTGEIKMEANVEYRFPIVGYLKGALVTDIGNIWLLNPNQTFPDGEFTFDSFLSQLAFDAGFGFRFDFNFFVFRIDPAIKLKDPSRPEHDRWILNQLQLKDIIWNFGIGYPF